MKLIRTTAPPSDDALHNAPHSASQNSPHSIHSAQDEQPVLRLANDADALTVVLEGVSRVELQFPKFSDGRAFSQAWLLRQRRGFAGDIRAVGEVLVDQLQQMQRCGFSSAALRADQDLAVAERELARFVGFYQADLRTN